MRSTVSKPYDPTTKVLVETAPEDWPVLVGLPRARTEVIDADIATVSGAADKALRVRPPYILHLEFQTGHDAAELPGLMHLRNALLDHRHGLPVRSAAILLRPEADSPRLTGVRVRAFPGEEPVDLFRYRVVRVWQLPVEELLAGGLGTLPLAPISAVTEAELPGIITRMDERLGRRRERRGDADRVWAATYLLMGLRYSGQLAEVLLRRVWSMEESVTYQAMMAKGEAKGRAEEARHLILLIGGNRFGAPDGETTKSLERITDLQRLEELSVRLLEVNSWQELLARPAARRRRPRSRE
jgi:predicted transposase YdaD